MRAAISAVLALLLVGATACIPEPTPGPNGDFGLAVGDPNGVFAANPECWNGDHTDGRDSTPDNVLVGPESFVEIEPHRLTPLPSSDDNVVTRSWVNYEWLDSGAKHGTGGYWYSRRSYGDKVGQLSQTMTQRMAFDYRGATSPSLADFGVVPSVESGPVKWTLRVGFAVNTGNPQVTCAAEIIAYAIGDPSAPADAVEMGNQAHPTQHMPDDPSGYPAVVEDQFAYIYPNGPVLGAPECDGHDDTPYEIDVGRAGVIRTEPDLEGDDLRQPPPGEPQLWAQDAWVFWDWGNGPQFVWRERVPNLLNIREFMEAGQARNVILPDGSLVQDYQEATMIVSSHFHRTDDPMDMTAMICEGRIKVR